VVLTISRQLASGGSVIGQAVSRRLGFKYLDREILQRAAAQLGVDDLRALEALEERTAGWWARIAGTVSAGAPEIGYVPPPPLAVHPGQLFEVERRIIREIADRGDAVIVGRGAPHVLHDRADVIRVFVHAPEARRIAEAARVYGLGTASARELVQRSDRQRARFVQGLIGRSWTDACLYDLTVDTSVVPVDLAADWVVRLMLARRGESPSGPEGPDGRGRESSLDV
jgi:cytidylate kinase